MKGSFSQFGKNLNNSKFGKGFGDFKKFISRGNVVDMAVGVIIGAAFGKIVTSLVNDMLMPVVGIFLGGVDFSTLSLKIGEAQVKYGAFIQTIIDFVIIAFTIFVAVKLFERLKRTEEALESPADSVPNAESTKSAESIAPAESTQNLAESTQNPADSAPSQEAVLLREIRDLLKNNTQ